MVECVGVDIVKSSPTRSSAYMTITRMTAKHIRIQKLIVSWWFARIEHNQHAIGIQQPDYIPVAWCDTVVRAIQHPDICSVEHDESVVRVASYQLVIRNQSVVTTETEYVAFDYTKTCLTLFHPSCKYTRCQLE
ncbi:hypothetical protein BDEG_21329 [Batrachochytrium dendrobatidis JEL423]|uniref:Uncharacterized protein n=1 Tax=Batrachochytrium dendrobatidis (strain JEL423) TaxID=403673 RepID=A0A177WAZ9_BATDL|nr:hypothetical protein BDEG_21329 [Batrachochytrium dendrobatidis JEL423]